MDTTAEEVLEEAGDIIHRTLAKLGRKKAIQNVPVRIFLGFLVIPIALIMLWVVDGIMLFLHSLMVVKLASIEIKRNCTPPRDQAAVIVRRLKRTEGHHEAKIRLKDFKKHLPKREAS